MGSVSILKASAGSGKTYRLVYEYIDALIHDPSIYRHILAVTFTNKATEEMKQRIVRELHCISSGSPSSYMDALCKSSGLSTQKVTERAKRALTNILHDYSHFSVLTIDKFFQNIIRSFLRELGINLDFNIELRTDTLLEAAADAMIEQTATDAQLKAWITEFVNEQLDSSDHWDIRRKLIGAGSEIFKEHWDMEAPTDDNLREKIATVVGRISAESKKVSTCMKAAATEAVSVIRHNGLEPEDFAYKSNGVGGYLDRTSKGEIAPYKTYVRKALDNDENWFSKSSAFEKKLRAVTPQLRPLLEQVCMLWDQNHQLLNSERLILKRFRSIGVLNDMVKQIQKLCSEQNVMSIAQTNHILRRLIEGNDTPFIFEKAGNHFSRFLIDEFQDTSRVQWENFIPLLQNAMSESDKTPVILVGDIKQSIYRWRGGDWKILSRDAGATLGEVIPEHLNTNYRSLENIVNFNNTAISECVERDSLYLLKELEQACDQGYISREHLIELSAMLPSAYHEHAQIHDTEKHGGYVTIAMRHGEDPQNIVDPVITRVEELQQRGYAPSDIAILVRRNSEAQTIARMMLNHKHAHPGSPYSYDVVTAEALTVGSSVIVEFIAACLNIAISSDDALSRAIWNKYRGTPIHEAIPAGEEEFLASLRMYPVQEAFHKAVIKYDVASNGSETAYLQAFHEQIVRFCNSNIADIPLFMNWWRESGCRETIYMPPSESAINIITVHKAKGLERKAVILPYCSWSLAPKTHSTIWVDCKGTPFEPLDKMAVGFEKLISQSCFSADYYTELVLSHIDNINLLYVALTRARDELHIFMPSKRGKEPVASYGSVADLLVGALDLDEGNIGEMHGKKVREDDVMTVLEFGEAVAQKDTARENQCRVYTGYPTRDPQMKVRLRTPLFRYTEEDGGSPELSPRNYGMLMHRVFENALSQSDLSASIAALRQDGSISQQEALIVEELVYDAMKNPIINSWFSGDWERVHNEKDIIMPHQGQRRPDRVMTRATHAVIVDYKFGMKIDRSHQTQISDYKNILSQMGYTRVEGYLWYVSLEEIIKVNG